MLFCQLRMLRPSLLILTSSNRDSTVISLRFSKVSLCQFWLSFWQIYIFPSSLQLGVAYTCYAVNFFVIWHYDGFSWNKDNLFGINCISIGLQVSNQWFPSVLYNICQNCNYMQSIPVEYWDHCIFACSDFSTASVAWLRTIFSCMYLLYHCWEWMQCW